MPIAVFALALAAFCIGSTEFIVSGILLAVSHDLDVSIPTAGLLVTGYAAGVAVGGPILGLLMTRIPLKPAILGVMTIFAIGQLLCALAPNYSLLLGARLISACGHGVFFGVASVAISQLVPPERRGAALSLFVGGITIANILGLPGGTAIGNAFGWRATFVVIAVLAVVSVIAVFFALPAETKGEAEADAPLKLQAQQLLHQEVFLTYLAIAIIMVGQLAFGTFQVAMLTRVTGISEGLVPYYLLAGGAGAVVGIWLGGKGADWNIDLSMLIIIVGQIVTFGLLLVVVYNPIAIGFGLFLSAAFGFGFSTPVQLRILHGARAAPRLASTMVSTAYNVGIAAGAALGAILLNAGLSYAMLPITGIVTSTLAGLVTIISIRLPHGSSMLEAAMAPALLALFAAAFAIGTSEFVIAGILPAVSTDLSISIPTAALLVSLYALGVAVGGPLLATFTGRYPKKLLLLIYVGIFVVGYAFCAVAPSFTALLVARICIALIHGAYFGTAMVVATAVVEEKRRGFAVALILSGLTVANIIGVPIGTAIGTAFGWRMTFGAVCAIGVVAFALIALLVPSTGTGDTPHGNFAAELKVLTREPVYTSIAVIVVQTVGQFALFTYISPLLTTVSGIDINVVPWLLLLFGVGSTIGVLTGGRLADWKLMASLTGILALQVVVYLLMVLPLVTMPWVMGALVLVWGALGFAFGSPAQTRILANTRDAPLLASSLIPSSFNVAMAFGAWFGGTLIDHGSSYAVLPWIGVVSAALATTISAVSWARERAAGAARR